MVSQAMRQIILISFICFGTIGMFNAMSSIGNAGKHSPTAQNLAITSSSIAYIIGFLVAGGTHNMFGPRPCVAFGGLTFVLYAGAMMLAKDNEHSLYPPLAGILLGLGAGCIWVTQGAMMMSYPAEDNKGKYIACFWAIFNLGAVLGSALPLAMNSKDGMDPDDVSSDTYIVYMVIMGLASFLAIFLVRPSGIVRDDGEPVIVAKFGGVKSEFLAILSVFCDWRMLLLIPAFFFSNFSYTYQFNDFNGFNFNIRTRSLNSILFWVAQIIGALVIGYLLDRLPMKRPRRAMLGLLVIAFLFMATWIGALMMQLKHKWERRIVDHTKDLIDYEHADSYPGPLAIYAMFGFCDAAFAVYCYWLMGALSNKHDELSRYAGFFKSIQSLGSAVAAPLDLAQTPLLAYLITNWILCAFSIAAMFLVCRTITDTTVENSQEIGDEEEMYEADACSGRSTSQEGGDDGQPRPSMNHCSSFEENTSTICANSPRSKPACRCGSRSSEKSGYWRTSKSTNNDEDQEPCISPHCLSRTSTATANSVQPKRSSSVTSATSMGDRMASSSPTFQHSPQHAQRNISQLHRTASPPMAEVRNDTLPLALQSHLAVPSTQGQPRIPSISLTPDTASDARSGIESSGVAAAATATAGSAPTFVFSHEPSSSTNHNPYLNSSWATSGHSQTGSPMIGLLATADPSASSSSVSHLQPHEYLNAPLDGLAPVSGQRISFGGASSSGSTRYDEEQDMDSIDTCSLSSMSSGHDSIPEMSEMP
ncbi:MAG: major facilitator superfamily domain-containing protein [Benniella sp.]|nr:MAG: major facilitator superfamily domain-containing protein [Benniella sp.]